MSTPPDHTTLADNEIAIFFDTNERIDGTLIAKFVVELAPLLFPDTAQIDSHAPFLELVHLETGTTLMRLAAWATILQTPFTIMGGIGTVQTALKQPESEIAKCTARMVLDHGVVSTQVLDCTGTLTVTREMMPAVRDLELHRNEAGVERRWTESTAEPLETTQGAKTGHLLQSWNVNEEIVETIPPKNTVLEIADRTALLEIPRGTELRDAEAMRGNLQKTAVNKLIFMARDGTAFPINMSGLPPETTKNAVTLYYSLGQNGRATVLGVDSR